MQEVIVLRNEKDRTSLNIFQVDDNTLAKMIRVRGNLYQDDPRLRLVKDIPTPKPEITISPEMRQRAEEAWRLHCMVQDAGTRAAASTPEQPQPMTFDEQIKHDWRFNPGIRKEFTSFGSYQAYKRAEEVGRVRVFGRA